MVPESVKHIKDIILNGHHREKTRKELISKINNAIDKFNESNIKIADKVFLYASEQVRELFLEKFPGYSNMLLKYQNYVLKDTNNSENIHKMILEYEESRNKEFKKLISQWSNSSKLSVKEINYLVSDWLKYLDKDTEQRIKLLQRLCVEKIDEYILECQKKLEKIVSEKNDKLQKNVMIGSMK